MTVAEVEPIEAPLVIPAIGRVCADDGCEARTVRGTRYCETHYRAAMERTKAAMRVRDTGTATQREVDPAAVRRSHEALAERIMAVLREADPEPVRRAELDRQIRGSQSAISAACRILRESHQVKVVSNTGASGYVLWAWTPPAIDPAAPTTRPPAPPFDPAPLAAEIRDLVATDPGTRWTTSRVREALRNDGRQLKAATDLAVERGWVERRTGSPRRLQGLYAPGTAPANDVDARTVAAYVHGVGRASRQEIAAATGLGIGEVDAGIRHGVAEGWVTVAYGGPNGGVVPGEKPQGSEPRPPGVLTPEQRERQLRAIRELAEARRR